MKTMLLVCASLLAPALTQAAPVVDVERTPAARAQLLELPWIQEKIEEVRRTKIDDVTFPDQKPYIVSRKSEDVPGYDPAIYSFQSQHLMYISNDYRWLCEIRAYTVWHTERVELVKEAFQPEKMFCFPRI
jgi:hypothetical protein